MSGLLTAAEIAAMRACVDGSAPTTQGAGALPDSCTISTKVPAKTGTGGTTYTKTARQADVACSKATIHTTAFIGGQRVSVAVSIVVTFAAGTDVHDSDILTFADGDYEVTGVRTRGAWELARRVEVKALT